MMAESKPGLMSEEELTFLKENRKYLRTKITRYCTCVENNIDQLSLEQCEEYLEVFQDYRDKASEANNNISKGLWIYEQNRDRLDDEMDRCEKYDIDIRSAIKSLNKRISALNISPLNNSNLDNSSSFVSSATSQIKLPHIPLPEYSHEIGESLELFFRNFETIIDKYSLSEYEKYIFLSRQVKGEPLVLIKSLQGSDQSYSQAKALLTKAFSSPLMQQYEILDSLSKINLAENGEPYNFVSDMKILIQSYRSLKIESDIVLQYFFWKAMPERLKSQFVNITNCTKPSLAQIEENIFEAIDRWRAVRNADRMSGVTFKPDVVSSFAAKVNYGESKATPKKYKPCILCSTSDHPADHSISRCDNYKLPSQKVDKLKSLNYCIKCATSSHNSNDCRFKFFNNCINCGGKHFVFLCTTNKNVGKTRNSDRGSSRVVVNNSTATLSHDSFAAISSNLSILPTFSANFCASGRGIRILKDSGAQASFIKNSVAVRENMEVSKDNIMINVNGFNSAVKYETRIVNFELKIGNLKHRIEAICVPDISTKLKLPGLSDITRAFSDKGYKFADEYIYSPDDSIDNIEMILGSNFSYCIPETNICFGSQCIYSDTPAGVMLVGSLNKLSMNIDKLPIKSNNVECQTVASVSQNDCTDDVFDPPYEEDVDLQNLVVNVNHVSLDYCVTDEFGLIEDNKLNKATLSIMDDCYYNSSGNHSNSLFSCDDSLEKSNVFHDENVKLTLDNCSRAENGRLIMPLMWDNSISEYLPRNFNISKQILQSCLKKLTKDKERLLMVDNVFREQQDIGIISRIDDLESFIETHPKSSFLGHMPIFKMNNESTKCRVVYLSNVCEKGKFGKRTVSHNMAINTGPPLNQKNSTALTLLRFDKRIITYDIVKAFLAIELYPEDAERLCFLWVQNAAEGDFSIVGYVMNRLMFGLRCSPAILMLSLYKILIIDATNDSEYLIRLKQLMYSLLYMDNGAIGADSSEELLRAYTHLKGIFSPYKIELQQFVTNDELVQSHIAGNVEISRVEKLLGINWFVKDDMLSPPQIVLDKCANTKRKILKSIASNYDVLNISSPLLNRARLFLHSLQMDSTYGWDTPIRVTEDNTWKLICKQVENSSPLYISRFVGRRDDSYDLVAFTDSSKAMFGVVIYAINSDGESKFLMSKNRMVGKQLMNKSIPCLELLAVQLGVETLIDTYIELSGDQCMNPININNLMLYSDSLVCLNWIQNHSSKSVKMNKMNVFVMNRLRKICNSCEVKPIKFGYCAGAQNPSDIVTRPISYKQLMKTNYLHGLDRKNLEILDSGDFPSIIVPDNSSDNNNIACNEVNLSYCSDLDITESVPNLDNCSDFRKVINVQSKVFKFINVLKARLNSKFPSKYSFTILSDSDIASRSYVSVISADQQSNFANIFDFLNSKNRNIKDIPPLVNQLNVFRDDNGILRVKTKMQRWKEREDRNDYPILLCKSSRLTDLVIVHVHKKLCHSGLYATLSEFRKQFYVSHAFSVLKKSLKRCIPCNKLNNRPIKLSQSPYREFRISPTNIPFKSVFIDHAGPFLVKYNGSNIKCYLLIITCLWSRAVNVEYCYDLSVTSFIRGFQLHIFKYGIPEICISDQGTSLVSGANIISNIIQDEYCKTFLADRNIKPIEFTQYPKGCNDLGGLVESCVKMVKRLIFGSIRKLIIDVEDFKFLIAQVNNIVNKRPIAFKATLRDQALKDIIPSCITPEILLHGREINSLCVVPELNVSREEIVDKTWNFGITNLSKHVDESNVKLSEARNLIYKLYNEEFIPQLIYQAANVPGRYKPVSYKSLEIGDIVLLKEDLHKPSQYPMAMVLEVVKNSLNETTEALLRNGVTGRKVRRHASSIIPLISHSDYVNEDSISDALDPAHHKRPKRDAAIRGAAKTRNILRNIS